MGEKHSKEEFGKRNPTVFGANMNDPELTALSAPYLIRQAGVDERAAAGRLVAPAPQPHLVETVPIWVWVAVFVVMFVVGVAGLWFMRSHGMPQPGY